MAAEDAMCGKGYELTLFLFTDIIVVAKVTYHQWSGSGVTIICVLQRKTAKGMGMMRSPSAASLAAGQQNVLPHKVRNFEILTYLVTSLSMIIRFVIVRGVTYIEPVVSST